MKKSLKYREVIQDARRVVVKIGSRVLCQKTGRPDMRSMRRLSHEISSIMDSNREVVIITSGAVGTGMEALGMERRPDKLPDLQMAAAVGQCRLITRYDDLFKAQGYKVGQVLLTHADFQHRLRLTNARRTLENLLRHRVIPIVNENDVVADEEIRAELALGDNDYLASLVVKLIRADLLILLTTVDGVRARDKRGRSQRIRYIESINRSTFGLVNDSKSPLSKGGMYSKLKAAESVAKAGCSIVIANGRSRDVLPRIMRGEDVGTLVLASAV
jgi:glutamate 5-kinase